jgi:hypothetical protein
MAVAICVIPYVFTRACQAFTEMDRQREMLKALDSMRASKPLAGTPRPTPASEPAPDVIL